MRKEASGASEDGDGGLQWVGSQEPEGKQGCYQNGEEGIRAGEHCTEQLKKVSETPEEKVRRHQDNPHEVKELTQRIRVLYENGGEKRPLRTKHLTGEIERGNNTVTDVTSILYSTEHHSTIHHHTQQHHFGPTEYIPAIRLPIQYTSLLTIAFFNSAPSSTTSRVKNINASHIELPSKPRA